MSLDWIWELATCPLLFLVLAICESTLWYFGNIENHFHTGCTANSFKHVLVHAYSSVTQRSVYIAQPAVP